MAIHNICTYDKHECKTQQTRNAVVSPPSVKNTTCLAEWAKNCQLLSQDKKHLKNVGPICYCKSTLHLCPQRQRVTGDHYGPMEWAQQYLAINSVYMYSVGQIIRNQIAISVSEFLLVDTKIFCEYGGVFGYKITG